MSHFPANGKWTVAPFQSFGPSMHYTLHATLSQQLLTRTETKHSYTDAQHWEQFGVQCLAQGHFDCSDRRRGSNLQLSDQRTTSSTSEPQPQSVAIAASLWFVYIAGLLHVQLSKATELLFLTSTSVNEGFISTEPKLVIVRTVERLAKTFWVNFLLFLSTLNEVTML